MLYRHTARLGVKTIAGALVIVSLSSSSVSSFSHIQYGQYDKSDLGAGEPYSGDQVGTGTNNEDWGDSYSGRQTGTGVRNDCPATAYPLVALIPDTHWSQTTQDRPTFWFYVPYTSDQDTFGEFSIEYWNEDASIDDLSEENYRYDEFSVDLTNQAGFVSVTLPDSIDPLEPGLDYEWTFKIFCGSQSITPVLVSGWVQFNDAYTNLPASYDAYIEERIWLDAVNHLAQQRLVRPEDITLVEEWKQLLQSGGLEPELVPVGPILGELMIDEK